MGSLALQQHHLSLRGELCNTAVQHLNGCQCCVSHFTFEIWRLMPRVYDFHLLDGYSVYSQNLFLRRLKKRTLFSSRLRCEAVKRKLLCDRWTQCDCKWNFSLSRQHASSRRTRSAAHFLFLGQPGTEDKMDADVIGLAKVTDGLIIQTHPSGHRKTQHLAC